jgi:hypothetical protein
VGEWVSGAGFGSEVDGRVDGAVLDCVMDVSGWSLRVMILR